ncbi:aminoglycoside phosphotransferase family protein [Dactylosporangium sp. NPDC005555]|uniref:aminoglycoside phosphotransferase family protein n=1 Tax=Dactylosporangium sp. NPDC005555 TaxID=3154889 RepID=UPI0033AC6ED8
MGSTGGADGTSGAGAASKTSVTNTADGANTTSTTSATGTTGATNTAGGANTTSIAGTTGATNTTGGANTTSAAGTTGGVGTTGGAEPVADVVERALATVDAALPTTVRAKAEAAGAHDWLRRLPELVAGIEEDWAVRVGRVYSDATEAFVADVTMADGTPAVLKLIVPRPGNATANEITVLRLAGGDGCARLLRHDVARDALLLEKLGPSLSELGLPITRRHEILCDVASRVWRPAPDAGLPTGAAKGEWLAAFITDLWERLDRPCAEQTVAHALSCAERRVAAHDDERAVLVHGDVHEWNTLRAADGFRLVDPDGLLAEAEYDLGVIMREDPVELVAADPRDRSRWLAARTGLDETAIWEWGVVERVSTGLVLVQVGLQPLAAQMLAAADTITAMRI